jgi:ParB/RepB/Spo0J family partition protein
MKIVEVQIHKVVEGYHPRKGLKGNEELRKQIQKNGMTEPIRVRPEGDHFVVIDGVRRLQVARDLGWTSVPCIIEEIDERTAAHRSYLHNSADCRRNLNPIEVALHIKEMRDRFGYSILDLVGLGYAKDDQTLYNKLALLSLPEEIQSQIAEGTINPTEGYRLAAVKDAGLQKKAAEIVLASKDRSVRKTEKIIKTLIASVNRPESENAVPGPSHEGDIPGVFFHDSGDMHEFEDGTIPLIIVSPSYGVGMEYEEGVSFEQHIEDLKRCVPEWGRKLMQGGHLCINFGDIHNFGSKNGTEPEIQLMGQVFQDLLRPLNIRLRDIVIWDKGLPWTTNPQVIAYIDTPHTEYRLLNSFEYIYIFKKDGKRELPLDSALKSTITKDEWKAWISGIWKIRTVPSQKDHPAQFPEELPTRLIKMFSCEGDIVVDTALGSGTTIKVARELNRKGYGYERDLRYKPVIIKKLGIAEEKLKQKDEKTDRDSTKEGKPDGIRQAIEEFLPQIAAESMGKGERIRKISFDRKHRLSKEDIIVDTVPFAGCFTGSASGPSPLPNRPDDYEKELDGLRPAASALAEVA